MKKLFYIFFISMIPVIELRGSIIAGAAMEMPWIECFIVSIIGNFLPVPFILLFIKKILSFMKTKPKLEGIAGWLEDKAAKRSEKVTKYETLGLLLFVAIPLPGTGAWTGSLIASLMNMKLSYAIVSIAAGVVIAGFIMSGVAYGFLGFLDFLLF